MYNQAVHLSALHFLKLYRIFSVLPGYILFNKFTASKGGKEIDKSLKGTGNQILKENKGYTYTRIYKSGGSVNRAIRESTYSYLGINRK